MANGVLHPLTKKTITKYKQLIVDPITQEVRETTMYKEAWCLTQGYGEIGSTCYTEGTDTMRFINLEGTTHIPRDRIVTYTRIVVDYREQKKRPKKGANNRRELSQRCV